MAKCPKCGGTRLETFRMPYGPMWCEDCGFRIEHKEEPGNPFLDDEAPAESPPTKRRPGLGEQMARMMEQKRKRKNK